MLDQELEHFDVRAMTRHELARHADFARNMLFAASAASLTILGAGAFFLNALDRIAHLVRAVRVVGHEILGAHARQAERDDAGEQDPAGGGVETIVHALGIPR